MHRIILYNSHEHPLSITGRCRQMRAGHAVSELDGARRREQFSAVNYGRATARWCI